MTYSELQLIAESSTAHVNNVKLIDYLDQARKVWYQYCKSLGVEALVVHISANFKKEVFNQNLLDIRTELDKVGNTSFTLKQTIMTDSRELAVSAEVVLATIDLDTRTKTRVPDQVRTLLQYDALLTQMITNGK